MSQKNPYKDFVGRYLARGAVGVSVGLAVIAPASAVQHPETNGNEPSAARSFSDRLSTLRSAVSEHVNELANVAQLVPPAPPFSNAPPFTKVPEGPQGPFTNVFHKITPPHDDKEK
jgi:hypothetical protein